MRENNRKSQDIIGAEEDYYILGERQIEEHENDEEEFIDCGTPLTVFFCFRKC